MKKQFALVLVSSIILSLTGCAMDHDQEWYNNGSQYVISNLGAYKVKFPGPPKHVFFDKFSNQTSQGLALDFAKRHNVSDIQAFVWTGPDMKLTSTYCIDNNKDPGQTEATIEKAIALCLGKFSLKENSRERVAIMGGGDGVMVLGTNASNDSFKLYILLDPQNGVDHIYLAEGKFNAMEGPEAKQFFDSMTIHNRNVGYMGDT